VPTSLGGEGVDAPTSEAEDEAAVTPERSEPASAEEPRATGLHLTRSSKSAKDKFVLKSVEVDGRAGATVTDSDDTPEPPPAGGGRPTLRRIK